jgi:hypothetical protein
MATKTIDDKGRLTLGRAYAGKLVEVDEQEGTVVLTICRAVPEHEAWLWENKIALGMVRRGLQEARTGEFGDGPDLAEAFDFADSLPD